MIAGSKKHDELAEAGTSRSDAALTTVTADGGVAPSAVPSPARATLDHLQEAVENGALNKPSAATIIIRSAVLLTVVGVCLGFWLAVLS